MRFNILGALDQRDAYGLAAVAHGVISVKEAAHEFLGAGIEHLLFSQVGVAVVAVTHEKEFVFLPVKDQAGAQLSKRPSFVQGYGNEDIADVVSGFFHPFAVPCFFKVAAGTVFMFDHAGRSCLDIEIVLAGGQGSGRHEQGDEEKQGRCFHGEKRVSDLLK